MIVTNIYWSQINYYRYGQIIKFGLKIERSIIAKFYVDPYVITDSSKRSFRWCRLWTLTFLKILYQNWIAPQDPIPWLNKSLHTGSKSPVRQWWQFGGFCGRKSLQSIIVRNTFWGIGAVFKEIGAWFWKNIINLLIISSILQQYLLYY